MSTEQSWDTAFHVVMKAFLSAKLGKPVGRVVVEYDEGYRYSSCTFADPSFHVVVYGPNEEYINSFYNGDAASFMADLFTWEEQ